MKDMADRLKMESPWQSSSVGIVRELKVGKDRDGNNLAKDQTNHSSGQ